jgi:hypothetical protein
VKTTLTSEDKPGWYVCRLVIGPMHEEEFAFYWNGKRLCRGPGGVQVKRKMADYDNFRRLTEVPPTIIGDGQTMVQPGRYRIAMGSDNEHDITEPFVSWKGWTYQRVNPQPADGGIAREE